MKICQMGCHATVPRSSHLPAKNMLPSTLGQSADSVDITLVRHSTPCLFHQTAASVTGADVVTFGCGWYPTRQIEKRSGAFFFVEFHLYLHFLSTSHQTPKRIIHTVVFFLKDVWCYQTPRDTRDNIIHVSFICTVD